eukprot:Phypoly_transcript_03594.p1 GENE.Phypoly_transcript_03594~~Phypoly_transcript_03594.p1  ORF type:complete len:545 (-),score=57.71 Phypoly_transcript_03594:11-1645(-)
MKKDHLGWLYCARWQVHASNSVITPETIIIIVPLVMLLLAKRFPATTITSRLQACNKLRYTIPLFSTTVPTTVPPSPPFHACIVGSGPSGFYACEAILSKCPNAHITIFERLPIPFGLIRYGVAPDHPEVKLVQNKFDELLRDNSKSCSFVGNIKVGEDISIPELQKLYHAVILAYGSANEKMLGIPGEDIKGVYSARSFVAWLNGHPDFQKEEFDLSTSTQAVVIGQGNVALDVARILLRSTKELQATDITDVAVQQLSTSKIQEVHIVGRRGPMQAAFTTKEFRELLALPNVETYIADASVLPSESALTHLDRPKRRLLELIMKLHPPSNGSSTSKKRLYFHFFRRPISFFKKSSLSDMCEGTALGGLKLEVTKLSAEGTDVGTNEYTDLQCGVAFRSIGYKSAKMPDVPYDDIKGIVPNDMGRVIISNLANHNVKPVPNLYVAGWLKRGPSGIIATNKWDAEETAQCVIADWQQTLSIAPATPVLGIDGLHALLAAKGVRAVSFAEWKKIDNEERRRGKERGKPLAKFTIVNDMLELLTKS